MELQILLYKLINSILLPVKYEIVENFTVVNQRKYLNII